MTQVDELDRDGTSEKACRDMSRDLLEAIWGTDQISRILQTRSHISQISTTEQWHCAQDFLFGSTRKFRES